MHSTRTSGMVTIRMFMVRSSLSSTFSTTSTSLVSSSRPSRRSSSSSSSLPASPPVAPSSFPPLPSSPSRPSASGLTGGRFRSGCLGPASASVSRSLSGSRSTLQPMKSFRMDLGSPPSSLRKAPLGEEGTDDPHTLIGFG
ncbi:hypothetical protein EYF80_031582 [Liparis tanakae]|uniref:Uncharacterized protein n=1 Tax=Liparis tanakae TaxID=230148 RepID=A0A4Z2H004_9TELE|nr:hypothetical protein EYF80_031582 [Liparis tanakae]